MAQKTIPGRLLVAVRERADLDYASPRMDESMAEGELRINNRLGASGCAWQIYESRQETC